MKKFLRLAAIASAVVMAFGTLSLAACGKDKTVDNKKDEEGDASIIPEIPMDKNLTDVAVTGDVNTILNSLGVGNINASNDLSYKAYMYSNSQIGRDTVIDSHPYKLTDNRALEYNSQGKFLLKGGKTYYSDDRHREYDSYYYNTFFHNSENRQIENENSEDTEFDLSFVLDNGIMHGNEVGSIKILENGEQDIRNLDDIFLVKDKKLSNYADCNALLRDTSTPTSIYSYVEELEYAIRDYLSYQSDEYYAYWGGYFQNIDYYETLMWQLRDELGDSFNLKNYVKNYDVTLKAGDNAFFADIARTIEIHVPSTNEDYLFENRVVIYGDLSAGNSENSFDKIELSDKDKAIPGATLDPDEIITRFENGEEIDFGTLASGDIISAYITFDSSAIPYGYFPIIDYRDTSSTIPAGTYSDFRDYLSSVGETGDVDYELIMEYRNGDYDNFRYCALHCYSD